MNLIKTIESDITMSLNKTHVTPESEQRLYYRLRDKIDKCYSIRLTLIATILTAVLATVTSKNWDDIRITPSDLQLVLSAITAALISIASYKTVKLQRVFLSDMTDSTTKLVDVGIRLSMLTNLLACAWLVGQSAQQLWPAPITEAGLGLLLLSTQALAVSLVVPLIANFILTPSVRKMH